MLCEEVRRYLELMDGEEASTLVSEADRRSVADHLASCVNCRHFSQWLRRHDQAIGRAVRNVSVPADLRDRILQRLAEGPARLVARRRWRLVVTAAAAAILLAAGLVGLWLTRPSGPTPTDLDDEQLVSLAIAWKFEPLAPPPEAGKDWRTLQTWYRNTTNRELAWPKGLRRAFLRRVGHVQVQGASMTALEFVPAHAPRSSFLVVALPRARFDLHTSSAGGLRVLTDSHSVSVAAWSDGNAHFVVVYRGPFSDIRPCFHGLDTAAASLSLVGGAPVG